METQKNTENLRAYTLFSGSDGNSAYIRHKDTEILIDVGVSLRALEKALQKLDTSLSSINAIFITHEHIDHVKALKKITEKFDIPIFITEKSALALIDTTDGINYLERWNKIEVGVTYEVGNMQIIPFATSHDSAMSVGFVIKCMLFNGTAYKIGYATDLGYVSNEVFCALCGCNSAIVEANHDKTMLSFGKYPYVLKRRISSDKGHLSNEDCARLIAALVEHGAQKFLLAHLSKENNIPHLALQEVRSAVGNNEKIYIEIAQRDITCCLIDL